MQRVSSLLPSWEKRNSGSRAKAAPAGLSWWSAAANGKRSSSSNGPNGPNGLAGINTAAANADANGRVQREAFWPATLDLECDKAARILKSFCCDGFLAAADDQGDASSAPSEPMTPAKDTKKIPRRIIQNAAGIAVFTCMRSGLWMTGSGGSGILIARKSDGTWSPPSGIMLHTPTLSFIIGVDVYDCVLVVNNLAALESITGPRLTLGEDVGLTGGPLVSVESREAEVPRADLGNTVLAYMKARGQHQVVNLNGCILTERANENERFYAGNATQMDILSGNVARHVEETKPLFDVIKMAEGRTDYDAATVNKVAAAPAPGDAVIASPNSTPASPRNAFGIPSAHDPDPFGVLALEMAGLEIREAGTRTRPSSGQIDFGQTPSSPALSKFNRQSVETFTTRSNRGSYMSTHTTKSQGTDAGTQTDIGKTPVTTPSPGQSEDGVERTSFERIPEATEDKEDKEIDYTAVDLTPLKHLSQSHAIDIPETEKGTSTELGRDVGKLAAVSSADDLDKRSKASSVYDKEDDEGHATHDTNDADDEDDEEDEDEEEPVVFEVAQVQPTRTQAVASRMIQAKGSMVTIPKRVPPPLPQRSAARLSRSNRSEMGGDVAPLQSPLRQEFTGAEVEGAEEAEPHINGTADIAEPEGPKIEVHGGEEEPEGRKLEEIKAEEPTTEEAKPESEEPKTEELDEPKMEDAKTEEIKAEEPEAEESKAEQLNVEESKTEDVENVEGKSHETGASEANEADAQAESTRSTSVQAEDSSVDCDVTPTKTERPTSEDFTSQDPQLDEPLEQTEMAESKTDERETKGSKVEETSVEEPEPVARFVEKESDDAKDDVSLKTPPSEHSDNSDLASTQKHTSSIYTGATEDRWSVDGSSLTTPTSDRPFSGLGDVAGDDTPTKEKELSDMKEAESRKADESETSPAAVTAS